MKQYLHIIFLGLWFFSIMAPSVIVLLNIDEPVVVASLNEEEKQEKDKKNQGEEKILATNSSDFSMMAHSKKSSMGQMHTVIYFGYTLEILLPPPQYIS